MQTIVSNKTVIELGRGDLNKNKGILESVPIETNFEFWSIKRNRNVTKLSNKKVVELNSFHELHAQANLLNVDVTEWTPETVIQFRIGIHVTRE